LGNGVRGHRSCSSSFLSSVATLHYFNTLFVNGKWDGTGREWLGAQFIILCFVGFNSDGFSYLGSRGCKAAGNTDCDVPGFRSEPISNQRWRCSTSPIASTPRMRRHEAFIPWHSSDTANSSQPGRHSDK
jgi:hypothetical protein